jgi:hypothetical protein
MFHQRYFVNETNDQNKSPIYEVDEQARMRMKFFNMCQQLIAHNYKSPFFTTRKYQLKCAGTTQLGESILEFLLLHRALQRPDTLAQDLFEFAPELTKIIAIAAAAMSKAGKDVEGVGFVEALPVDPVSYMSAFDKSAVDVANAYAKLALQMRQSLLDPKTRAAVKNFRRNANERIKHAKHVAHLAWEKHSSILLIRLDWGFKKTYFKDRYCEMNQVEFGRCLSQVTKYRNQMLLILSKMFGTNLAFYLWKIECGDKKGIHIHWLIGINGSKHQDRINVGRKIQKEWDRAIDNNQTYTFNVNGLKYAQAAGLRVIHYNDPDICEIVDRFVSYLLKIDYTMKLRMPKGMRSFGCSKLKLPSRAKPGPKRKYLMPTLTSLATS